jgi:Cu-Zn family superoxide dismutase
MRRIQCSIWAIPGLLLVVGSGGLIAQHAGHQAAAAWSATASIRNAEGRAVGEARLRQTTKGVLVHVALTDAPRGIHALHLHTVGRCDAPSFDSAGEHFNPTGAGHGFDAATGAHAGDLPNLHVPPDGDLEVEVLAAHATLAGGPASLLDADGSALVLHASPDDYASDPAGNAGPRVACGVLAATASQPMSR